MNAPKQFGNAAHIQITESDFAKLVRGESIQILAQEGNPLAEICLADIGWDRMYFHIERALRDAGHGDL